MIESIVQLGDDSLSNEFQVVIPTFPGALDVGNTILRVNEFEIVDRKIGTYEIKYKTQKFTKPLAKNETENQFTFTFRVDKYYQTYKGFEAWLDSILDQATGVMNPDVVLGAASTIRVPIDVVPIDSLGNVTNPGWTYTGCFPSSLSGIKFNNVEDAAPVIATVTMQFIKIVPRT